MLFVSCLTKMKKILASALFLLLPSIGLSSPESLSSLENLMKASDRAIVATPVKIEMFDKNGSVIGEDKIKERPSEKHKARLYLRTERTIYTKAGETPRVIIVQSDVEYLVAQSLLGNRKIFFFKGAQFIPAMPGIFWEDLAQEEIVKASIPRSRYDNMIDGVVDFAVPLNAPSSDRMQYYAQVGDYFGGFWGTLIGLVTLGAVFLTWNSTRRIDNKSKIYQVFAEILRTHEEIVSSLKIEDKLGREAISVVLSEFYQAYEALVKLEAEEGIKLKLEGRINAAFLVVYYGAHPKTAKILESSVSRKVAVELCSRLSDQKKSRLADHFFKRIAEDFNGDPVDQALWEKEIKDAFAVVKSIYASEEQKKSLRWALTKAKTRPANQIDVHKIFGLVEEYAISTEFGNHQNRLSHYFRNLYSAFVFIDAQKLRKKEKESLSRVLRSKLSNYEQALLAINALTKQGSPWITEKLIKKYMPIKNIPEHFFDLGSDFDLKKMFPDVIFEWERYGQTAAANVTVAASSSINAAP